MCVRVHVYDACVYVCMCMCAFYVCTTVLCVHVIILTVHCASVVVSLVNLECASVSVRVCMYTFKHMILYIYKK